MTEGKDPATPPQDTGPPDQVETDPAALSSAEDLDEDRLKLDPLEEGIEPPERWAESDRYGTTPFEQHQGESLDERVLQEQDQEILSDQPERLREIDTRTPAEERGQSADKAGGSVADAIREPEEPE